MTDEKEKQSDDVQEFGDELETFEFDDADFEAGSADPSEMTDKLPPSLPAMNAKSKIPILFGVVIGLFLLYKGVNFFITPHKTAATASNLDDAPVLSMPTPKNADDPDLLKQTPGINPQADDASAFLSEANKLSDKESTIQPVALPDPVPAAAAPSVAVITTPTPAAPAVTPVLAEPIPAPTMTTAAPAATMPIPVAATPAPDSILTAAPTTVAIPPEVTTQIQQKLDTQTEENEKRLEAMDRAIYRLSKKMEQVQDSVGQLGSDMGNINQSLTTMTTEVKKISQPTMNAPMGMEQTPEPIKTEMLANPSMAVHAIIPGRAWLRDKNGRTITVTEGDMLDQYGKVLVIDAPNGVVVTSSGTTLR